ncbi:MAG: hypothetical protein U0271_02885 [Polyangiaceae bacterium]
MTAKGEPPPTVPAPLYASLFKPGNRWTLSGSWRHEALDEQGSPVDAVSDFKGDCTVDRVERFTWGLVADISCAGLPGGGSDPLIAGRWVATRDGLYRAGEVLDGRMELRPELLVFASQPATYERDTPDPHELGHQSSRAVRESQGEWCFEEAWVTGDEGWRSVCMTEQAGFTTGQYGWAGGSSDDVTYVAER